MTKRFTCNIESGIATNNVKSRPRVRRVTVVRAHIWSTPRVNYFHKEQLTAREEHVMRVWVLIGRHDRATVVVPGDDGGRIPLDLAVQGRRFVLQDMLIVGVVDDVRVSYLIFAETCRFDIGLYTKSSLQYIKLTKLVCLTNFTSASQKWPRDGSWNYMVYLALDTGLSSFW